MEFLRFGSSIPGGYWGCCAVCIIQNFKFDPEDKASIQLVSGDGGGALMNAGGEPLFAGPTYGDIFKQRIRIGTFSARDMPNHAFLAVLTDSQVNGTVGSKWLKILKEEGFEFIRTQDNSVYTGDSLSSTGSPHPNHIFGLFRNITGRRIKDPFTPPKAWTDLPKVVPESWELASDTDRKKFTDELTKVHKDRWKKTGPTKLCTEAEIKKAGAVVMLAGQRLPRLGSAPEPKEYREARQKAAQAASLAKATAFPSVAKKA